MTSKTLTLGVLTALLTACSANPTGNSALPPAATDSVERPVTSNARVVVAPTPVLTGVRDMGTAPSDTTLNLALTLRYRNENALDRLIAAQRTKGSSSYHHWLTNAQFNEKFAPLQRDYARVIAALGHAGLHVTQIYSNRTVIDAQGSAGHIERFFDTSIHRVGQPGHPAAYANVRSAFAPAALRDILLNVDGLDTLDVVHSFNRGVTGNAPHNVMRPQNAGAPYFGPPSAITGLFGYGPLSIATAYDLPVVHATGGGGTFDGTGRTIAVVIDADYSDSDLTGYLSYFGIKRDGPATDRILLHGGPPPNDEAIDSVEATLDTEVIASQAPGAALDLYEIPSLRLHLITDAYNKAVADDLADVVSSSFGGCEPLLESAPHAWDEVEKQGEAKGMTFTASSGDSGGSLCADAPASTPDAVGIGGTVLSTGIDGAWENETAWSGGGGGVSTYFARPAWQSAVVNTNPRGRNVPDVALDADPYTGIAFYYTGTWNTRNNPLGGTSLSSPIYAAAIAEIDQMKDARVGLNAESIYALWQTTGYSSGPTAYFHDIVQGSNGAYYAGPGYDLVTGIGSVDAFNVAAQI